MRKWLTYVGFIITSFVMFAESEFGIIQDSELKKVGVSDSNLTQAKTVIRRAENSYKMLVLEKRELELKVNKLMLDGPAKNLTTLDAMFDRMGAIESKILKERVRSQIEMQRYITQEQYTQARELAVQRLNRQK